jgi:hypothetical protein
MPNVLNIIGNPIITRLGAAAILTNQINVAANWSNAVKPLLLKLYQNDPPLTVETELAELVESTFTDYSGAFQFLNVVQLFDPDDKPILQGDVIQEIAGDPLVLPGQATGYYLVDEDETVLIAVERFAEVFPFDQAGDMVSVLPQIRLGGILPS